jgi:hypothetical protein
VNLNNTQAGLIRFVSSIIRGRYAPVHIDDPDRAGTFCGIDYVGKRLHMRVARFRGRIDCEKCNRAAERLWKVRGRKR